MKGNHREQLTIEIYSLRYLKKTLSKVPENERIFYIMLGSASNEVLMLLKNVLSVMRTPNFSNDIAAQANSANLMYMLRLISGRLVEASKLIKKNNQLIRKSYFDGVNPEAKQCYQEFLSYFSKSNLLNDIRNKFAFHHDPFAVTQALEMIPDDEELGDYLHDQIGNSLYYTAEVIHYAMLQRLTGLPVEESITRWLDDVIDQSRRFISFAQEFIRYFVTLHLPTELREVADDKEIIPVHSRHEVIMPFFIDPPVSITG